MRSLSTSTARNLGAYVTMTEGCPRVVPYAWRGAPHHATDALPDADHHRVRPHQVLDARLAKAGFFHPALAVSAGVVESGRRFDQHVEAHHQAERIL